MKARGDVCERCLWQSKRAKRSGSGRQAASEAKLTPGTATGAVCALRRPRGFECTDNHSRNEHAYPAGAAVVYTPPKCEAGQTEGSGGRGAGGGRLVKSPPPAAVFFPRFLLGIQKKSGRRGHRQYVPRRTAHPLRLTDVRHLPFARRGGFAFCTAGKRLPLKFQGELSRATEGI